MLRLREFFVAIAVSGAVVACSDDTGGTETVDAGSADMAGGGEEDAGNNGGGDVEVEEDAAFDGGDDVRDMGGGEADGGGEDLGGGAGLVGECDDPDSAWIWCDDFESDRLSSYFEYDDDDGDFVRADGAGVEGSYGMSTTFQASETSAGNLHLAFGETPSNYFDPVDDGTAKYRELYWRMYLKHESGWTGGGGNKLTRATIFADSNWSQAMIGHLWSGGDNSNYLVLDPASGTNTSGSVQTSGYNDFDNLRWLGIEPGTTPLFDSDHVGEWYCIEVHVRLNDAGQSNGVFEFWIDGNLEASSSGLNWVGSYSDYGLNAVFFENYWNDGSTQEQSRYFDNLVVSTERIGCGP